MASSRSDGADDVCNPMRDRCTLPLLEAAGANAREPNALPDRGTRGKFFLTKWTIVVIELNRALVLFRGHVPGVNGQSIRDRGRRQV